MEHLIDQHKSEDEKARLQLEQPNSRENEETKPLLKKQLDPKLNQLKLPNQK
jgi:hypothetical protein